jgi:hypothetical protein
LAAVSAETSEPASGAIITFVGFSIHATIVLRGEEKNVSMAGPGNGGYANAEA